jgi:copper chaperone NosL
MANNILNAAAQVGCRVKIAVLLSAINVLICGGGSPEDKPVDIYDDDVCTYCGMPISQVDFSSEILSDGKVFKFDDLACMDAFRTKHSQMKDRTIFVMGYGTKSWLRYENSMIIPTGIATPMGSGLVAFADTARAHASAKAHPPKKPM